MRPITREDMERVAKHNGEHRHAVLDPNAVLDILDERDNLRRALEWVAMCGCHRKCSMCETVVAKTLKEVES